MSWPTPAREYFEWQYLPKNLTRDQSSPPYNFRELFEKLQIWRSYDKDFVERLQSHYSYVVHATIFDFLKDYLQGKALNHPRIELPP